jgi:non-heme chloroperoxidase
MQADVNRGDSVVATVRLRDGETLNVICIGRGSPVLLVHAFASRAQHWLPHVLPLMHRFRFYLPDLRGFGKSHHTRLDSDDVFATYAHDIEDIMQHFGLQDVVLGGVSTGAYVCLTYNQLYGFGRIRKYLNIEHGADSAHQPGQFNGLFRERQAEYFAHFRQLLRITERQRHLPYWKLPLQHRLQLRDTVAATLRRSTHNRLLRNAISAGTGLAEPLFTRHVLPVDNWPVYLDVMRAFMIGRDTRAALGNIKVPTMVMAGRHSRFFTLEAQQELLHYIPHAELVIFEKAGHAPMVDQPLLFQKNLTRFLTS